MTVILGRTVEPLLVYLVPSDPFVVELQRVDDSDWTDLPHLELGDGTVWVATAGSAAVPADHSVARFDVPALDVDAAIAADVQTARLTLGGLVWAAGTVSVSRA